MISMSQARRMATQNPEKLLEEVSQLLREKREIKHERDAFRTILVQVYQRASKNSTMKDIAELCKPLVDSS
jgi:hypothetical protein